MMKWIRMMVMAVASLLFLGGQGTLFAAEEKEKKWFENVNVSGFVDVYYGYNFNQPGNGPGGVRENQLRNFDLHNDQFSLSLFELSIRKDPAPFGFRVDLDFGPTTEVVHGTEPTPAFGAAVGEAGNEIYKHLQEAYLTWQPNSMWKVEVGKFVTHMGFEVIESKDNWNYSRGLLFAFAIPFYHSGLRISHAHENFWVNGYIYNGWNNVTEDNAGKTFGAQLGLNPIKGLTVIQNWIGGPEPGANEGRHVFDTIVMFSPVDMLSLGLNYDYGWMDTGVGDNIWSGIAAYARIAPTDRLAFTTRLEWFDDKSGAVTATPTGVGEIIKEVTVTAEHKCSENLLTRLEYRSDWSTGNIFNSDTGTANTDTQDTITLGLVYSF
jgi:hypothetical protein